MNNLQKLMLLALSTLTLGCSGTLYTAHDVTRDGNGGFNKVEGVIVYPRVSVYELYEFRAYMDPMSKQITRVAGDDKDKNCKAQPKVKHAVRVDFSRPYRVWYENGFLEKYKFAVELDGGALKSVNTESDASSGATATGALIDPLTDIFGTSEDEGRTDAGGWTPCNHTEVFVGVYEAPATLSASELARKLRTYD